MTLNIIIRIIKRVLTLLPFINRFKISNTFFLMISSFPILSFDALPMDSFCFHGEGDMHKIVDYKFLRVNDCKNMMVSQTRYKLY